MTLNLKECRDKYGCGFTYFCPKPVLGDVLIQDNNNIQYSDETVFIVIACNEYDLTLSVIGNGQSTLVFMRPLEKVGKYTDFYVIGNILGAIAHDKRICKERNRQYIKQTLTGIKNK